jgi:beta-galactosidase
VLESDHPAITPTFDSVATVIATVVDANGVVVPNANNEISFQVSGPGVIAAVDSGDHTSHEPFQATQRLAYEGRCAALVKATAPSGAITRSASASGLDGASVGIAASAP